MKNLFMLSTLLMLTSNVFAWQPTDYSKVQKTLDALTKRGFDCDLTKFLNHKFKDDSKRQSTYEVECVGPQSKIETYIIESLDMSPSGSRCNQDVIQSMKLKPAPKPAPKTTPKTAPKPAPKK